MSEEKKNDGEAVIDTKARFIEILKSVDRAGIDNVIAGLEKIGFFAAPASTKFHCAFRGGLCQHSLNVYEQAVRILRVESEIRPDFLGGIPEDSVKVAALLHDVCKAEIYKTVEKFRKDKDGRWEKYLTFESDYSSMPLGHGEKSVIRLLRMGLDLTNDEIVAIRWHMANWSLSEDFESRGNFNAALDKTPLLSILIAADELATRISESEKPRAKEG